LFRPTQAPRRRGLLTRRAARVLETICRKCWERAPARRYGSAEALADDLERWLRGEPIVARPASAWERVGKWARRRPGVSALLGVAAGLLLAALGVLAWGRRQADGQGHGEADARKAAEKQAVAEGDARKAAEAKAAAEQQRAAEAARSERLVQAHLALEKGSNRIERGETVAGMLWLVRGLEVAPDDAGEL